MKTEGPGSGQQVPPERPSAEVRHIGDYDEAKRAEMKEKRNPIDRLKSEQVAHIPKQPGERTVIRPPRPWRLGKEQPRRTTQAGAIVIHGAPFGKRTPGASARVSSGVSSETAERAYTALAGEMGAQIQSLLWHVEQRGVVAGPKLLSVVFRDGVGDAERLSFLEALAPAVQAFDTALIRDLESMPFGAKAEIIQEQEPTGLAMGRTYASVRVDFHMPESVGSTWRGHLTEEPESEGEGPLGGVLSALIGDQRRKIQRRKMKKGKEGRMDKAAEWLRRIFKKIDRNS